MPTTPMKPLWKIDLRFFVMLLFFAFITNYQVAAQQNQAATIQFEKTLPKTLFTDFAKSLEQEYKIRIFYKEEWIKDFYVQGYYKGSLVDVLDNLLGKNALNAFYRDHYVIVYPKDERLFFNPDSLAKEFDTDLVTIGDGSVKVDKNEKVNISGFVKDGQSGNTLYGANLYVEELEDGVTTNKYGLYSIDLLPGLYRFKFDYLGYEPTIVQILVNNTGKFDVELYETSLALQEVTISDEGVDANVNSTNIGVTRLGIETIEKIPAFLGEVDVVKSLLLLPGVTTVGEGAGGFNIRGGSSDQNLFLFDGVPVFNAAHLFGFFSNFNPDVAKDVTLYKGGIPAKYGDRVSAVLDVRSKDPDNEKFRMHGGIGAVSSRLTTEIPIVKKKSALLLAGRTSYSDWILRRVNDLDIRNSSAQFYDANAKWTNTLGEKDKVTLSGYISNDKFKFAADTSYSWTTKNAALKWTHLFNDKLSSEVGITYADYSYTIEGLQEPLTFDLKSGIINKAVNLNFVYSMNEANTFTIGGRYGEYDFSPGNQTVDQSSEVIPVVLEEEYAREFALYIQDEITISDKISLLAGVRYSHYANIGPGNVLNYSSGEPRNEGSVIGSTDYNDGDVIQSYGGFEPRLSAKYSLNNNSSLKMSYNRIRQYIHTMSNTTAITPFDIWKSSDRFVKPQIGDQIAMGYFKNFNDNAIETSVEVYYKKIQNVIDYKNGAELLLNQNIEQVILSGEGRAYGVELFVKKKTGRVTGWASYTYSRTQRKIGGSTDEETINNGDWYAADYDKPHNLALVSNFQINRRWRIGTNFTYSTGRPITAPEAKFTINGVELAYFSERNQYRIPNYHRLDLSITLEGNHKRKKVLDGSWTLSFYNVYFRRNAYSVFFRDLPGEPPAAYKLAVLGTIFPSLTYNFSL